MSKPRKHRDDYIVKSLRDTKEQILFQQYGCYLQYTQQLSLHIHYIPPCSADSIPPCIAVFRH